MQKPTFITPFNKAPFVREERYFVLKISDMRKYLSVEKQEAVRAIAEKLNAGRTVDGKTVLQAVVVEHDWPEYELVWKMIQDRVQSPHIHFLNSHPDRRFWPIDALEQPKEPCLFQDMDKHACQNRHQCWEPCGELGKSEEHARVHTPEQGPSEYMLEVTCTKCGATESGVLKFTPPQKQKEPEQDPVACEEEHPNSRYLFKRLCGVAGIELGKDNVSQALDKIAKLRQTLLIQPAQPEQELAGVKEALALNSRAQFLIANIKESINFLDHNGAYATLEMLRVQCINPLTDIACSTTPPQRKPLTDEQKPRVDCGECPNITSGCESGHCMKQGNNK